MDLDSVAVHKHAKRELGQYPAILTSHLVENPYFCPVIYLFRLNAQRYHKSYRYGPFEWPSSTLVRSLPPPPPLPHHALLLGKNIIRLIST